MLFPRRERKKNTRKKKRKNTLTKEVEGKGQGKVAERNKSSFLNDSLFIYS